MRKSTYSASPYGQMRDRIEEKRKKETKQRKQIETDYYQWLVTGRARSIAKVANALGR